MEGTVEQAIRRSHCAATDRAAPDHRCVGTCTITPRGIELSCDRCGSDTQPAHPIPTTEACERAARILSAAGLEWDALADERQAAVVAALAATQCPHCRQFLPVSEGQYFRCGCGQYDWSRYHGWSQITRQKQQVTE